jgi:hypothetical protein
MRPTLGDPVAVVTFAFALRPQPPKITLRPSASNVVDLTKRLLRVRPS